MYKAVIMERQETYDEQHLVPAHLVRRAIKLSSAQAMLGAIYTASVGGLFIIGFALKLGATDVQIGLLSTVPMFSVVVQLLASFFVERGRSRKTMTIVAAMFSVLGYALVAALPAFTPSFSANARITMLISIITMITISGHILTNARSSWLGDLIPASTRGAFFGKMITYGGIVGVICSLIGGGIMDHMKRIGIHAFSWLFVFGMIFGLVNAVLFFPQSDVPTPRHNDGVRFFKLMRDTLRNRSLLVVMGFAITWSLQSIGAPFVTAYLLRDLKMPIFGVGLITSAASPMCLLSSPFWGRKADRYGCRPVLVVCAMALSPIPLLWYFVNSPTIAYALMLPCQLCSGFWAAGMSVALNTIVFKVTPSLGRSVHLAVYYIVVILCVAPMPAIGGHLPGLLKAIGISTDIRATFYACAIFCFCSALVARRIPEEKSMRVRQLARALAKDVPIVGRR